ncbi:enoyl-CoA hydratase-related protein [Mycobacteroides franklinii]|uniref:enoyl-CoA hydratase-related protein n=1 Tax=Mycobacteroides franklinii TaxID=948102 RepID=UPI0013E8AAEC|nr:enoyl-CoA hydratase [Mycobacteroides franklinii]
MSAVLTRDGAIATLTLGTDENRFTLPFIDEVNARIDEVLADEEPTALIVTGSGKFFSNGLDVDYLGANPDKLGWYITEVQKIFVRLLTLPVPTVAAVNGHAYGAGAMVALSCDYRVMRADRGFFCLPEVNVGLPFTPGMAALCQGRMTPQAASATMPSGQRYGGDDCVRLLIVEAAVPEAEVLSTAKGFVEPLVGKNRGTLGTIKNGMYSSIVPLLLAGLG